MKRLFWLSMGTLLGLALVVIYTQLSESQKRYITHLLSQAPYLPGRYMI